MAQPDFETTWYPRIGAEAAEKLRDLRKVAMFSPLNALFGVVAGVTIGRSAAGDLIGLLCALAFAINIGIFVRAQRNVASAVSHWFGVKIRWLPRMTPERFDEWIRLRGLATPEERRSRARGDGSVCP